MKNEVVVAMFEAVLKDAPLPNTRMGKGAYPEPAAAAWVARAETVLASVFPIAHPVRQQFAATIRDTNLMGIPSVLERAIGTFAGAGRTVVDGHNRSFAETIRAATVSEVLDQAEVLLASGYQVAAAVLAGGALETHLVHLIDHHGLQSSVVGDGSISRYDSAISQARNKGTTVVYQATDTKLVSAWGGMRNDAAHDPTTFTASKQDVQAMIDGIRSFVSRTTPT